MSNLLVALLNLIENPVTNALDHYKKIYKNRVNGMGEALEYYVKDLFCGPISNMDEKDRDLKYNKVFSYLGNQNNPPDFILENGDAFEVKKIEGFSSSLALNSSPPKDKLRSADPRITSDCRKCDGGKWKEKDLFYVVGHTENSVIKYIFFVQGTCYAADHKIYDKIHSPIKKNISSALDLLGFDNSETIELGKVKKADPLGITELRIRGMWSIKNPVEVFNSIAPINQKSKFSVNVVMLRDKYESFPSKDRKNAEKIMGKKLTVKNIKVKSPNNPANLLDAKLISFVI